MESMNLETAEQPIDCDGGKYNDSTQASSSDANAATHQEDPNTKPGTSRESKETTQLELGANADTLASKQLATGFLQIFEPPIDRVRGQLKELINKQNKIYVDLSAEKFKLDNGEMQEMMDDVKVYREKLLKIKKQMHQIHQSTQSLKKRAQHIEACKQKELERTIQKQEQEESLIGNK